MASSAIVDGIPLLCRTCNGPVEADGETGEVSCPYCGQRDRLPGDQQERIAELRRRLDQARAAVGQLHGVGERLLQLYERRGAFNYVVLPVAAVAVMVLLQAYQSWQAIQGIPAEQRGADTLYSVIAGPLMVFGFLVGSVVAVLLARWRYRRTVRPLLLARAPRKQGKSARCRACGADLPRLDAPLVTCGYCDTANLLSEELHRERTRLLAEERAEHEQRARGLHARSVNVSLDITRVSLVAMGLTYAVVIVLGVVLKALAG